MRLLLLAFFFGVTLEVAAQAPAGAPLSIAASPMLAAGPFEGAVTPFLMADGRLVVPEKASGSLRVHAPDGRLLMTLGGFGAEPGRLSWVRGAWSRGDTIEAFDSRRQRITRFLPDGSTEVLAVPRPVVDDGSSAPLGVGAADDVVGPLGAGWAVTAIAAVRWEARDRMVLHRLDRDLGATSGVAEAEGLLRQFYDDGSGPHPLSPTALFTVHRGEAYVAESLTPLVRVYDAAGAILREVSIPLAAPGLAGPLLDQIIDSATAVQTPSFPPDRLLRARSDPTNLSVFWDLVVDELGFLWIRPYEPLVHALALGGLPGGFGGRGGRWLVLSPEGAEVGWVEVPEGLELEQVTADAVVGVHRDGSGFESVRVHALRRR